MKIRNKSCSLFIVSPSNVLAIYNKISIFIKNLINTRKVKLFLMIRRFKENFYIFKKDEKKYKKSTLLFLFYTLSLLFLNNKIKELTKLYFNKLSDIKNILKAILKNKIEDIGLKKKSIKQLLNKKLLILT